MRQLAEPWAKTNSEYLTRSVFEHCFDVATVCHAIVVRAIERRRPCAAFGVELTGVHLARLAVLAGLHDFGKTLKGFQDKLDAPPGPSPGHVAEALAVLTAVPETRPALGIDLLRSWFDSPTDAMFVAICHHGEPVGEGKIRRHFATVRDLLWYNSLRARAHRRDGPTEGPPAGSFSDCVGTDGAIGLPTCGPASFRRHPYGSGLDGVGICL